MIIVIITLALLVAAIVLFVLCARSMKGKKIEDWSGTELFCKISATIFLMIAVAAIVVEVLGIVLTHCGSIEKHKYEKKLYEKEDLEYRLKNEGLSGNELLYRDITEFNNSLRDAKYWYEHPLTNWFNSGLIPNIDYIELDTNNNA